MEASLAGTCDGATCTLVLMYDEWALVLRRLLHIAAPAYMSPYVCDGGGGGGGVMLCDHAQRSQAHY
jgi:hypothetical protein